jgi:hypothetical protein
MFDQPTMTAAPFGTTSSFGASPAAKSSTSGFGSPFGSSSSNNNKPFSGGLSPTCNRNPFAHATDTKAAIHFGGTATFSQFLSYGSNNVPFSSAALANLFISKPTKPGNQHFCSPFGTNNNNVSSGSHHKASTAGTGTGSPVSPFGARPAGSFGCNDPCGGNATKKTNTRPPFGTFLSPTGGSFDFGTRKTTEPKSPFSSSDGTSGSGFAFSGAKNPFATTNPFAVTSSSNKKSVFAGSDPTYAGVEPASRDLFVSHLSRFSSSARFVVSKIGFAEDSPRLAQPAAPANPFVKKASTLSSSLLSSSKLFDFSTSLSSQPAFPAVATTSGTVQMFGSKPNPSPHFDLLTTSPNVLSQSKNMFEQQSSATFAFCRASEPTDYYRGFVLETPTPLWRPPPPVFAFLRHAIARLVRKVDRDFMDEQRGCVVSTPRAE